MTQKKPWNERLLERLPADSLLLRLLLESFQEHRWKYLAASGAMVLVAASTALSAWMMGEIIDTLSTPEDRRRVLMVGLGVAAIFSFKGIAFYAQAVLMARAGNRIVAQKQMQLYSRLLQQGVAFFNTNESSDLLLKITQSAQMARRAIDTIVTGFIRDLLTLVGLVAVMFYQQPFLSLISLIVGPAALYGLQTDPQEGARGSWRRKWPGWARSSRSCRKPRPGRAWSRPSGWSRAWPTGWMWPCARSKTVPTGWCSLRRRRCRFWM